jgi:hypothetical protein
VTFNGEPQGFNIVEPETAVMLGGPPFDWYPQLVFPIRILDPPTPDTIGVKPIVFTVGLVVHNAHFIRGIETPVVW